MRSNGDTPALHGNSILGCGLDILTGLYSDGAGMVLILCIDGMDRHVGSRGRHGSFSLVALSIALRACRLSDIKLIWFTGLRCE